MDWVRFSYPHSASPAEAATKVAAAASAICSRCQLEMTTGKNLTTLSGKIMRGSISSRRNELNISIVLVGQVTPTRASVEAGIREALDRQFAPAPGDGRSAAPRGKATARRPLGGR
ncbi:MAG TPA: hypothetical protein PK280_02890 [Planctomycetota bacterium]|nr:hypothetical protein [Planctomycetota bacterium]